MLQAAGVIPYSFDERGVMHLLLGFEDRTKKDSKCPRSWNLFGGKRELFERRPSSTAIREFVEETLKVLTLGKFDAIKEAMEHSQMPKIWNAAGKFVAFFVHITFDVTIPQKFAEQRIGTPLTSVCKQLYLQ